MPLTDLLLTPLSYPFMQHALLSSVVVGAVCAVLSCYVVLKGWSLMGDAISHAVFPGVIVAFWLGVPMSLGAFVAGLFCAISVGFLKNNTRIKEDTLMGIVFAGMFAVGLVMFTKIDTDQHLKHILFGNLLGISREMLIQTMIICGAILGAVLLKGKDLLLYCFDPSHARVAGLSPKVLHYGLLILLSATIVVAMQAVGVILVVAMLISPGITAFVLCRRFHTMLAVAVVSSCLTSFLGVILSFHLDSATGATIVLLQAVVFILAVVISKIKEKRQS
ncbi:metal ABC transporter permease [Moraxella bovis]|uniref:Manganese transport system membrane protein mntB n=2 Tax=Moraxella bovis TaxID=476 RepID=A0A378PRI7_MORBO|nr:metal ABC transporter permease [Moraxella bovis]UYZ75814.1 metal ABC transporter permease [Moraxella bovis]UYZ78245.1 metal ABC transporter permease [Moraxella bovis]UYZ81131.1 metal ABC transporter permease [Moraxella bovis]UYZ86728.1 metal ABC transporter permease [Moraxella bovis]UYZ89577.1 metal ABC transporter permease [Moraxella bovis]